MTESPANCLNRAIDLDRAGEIDSARDLLLRLAASIPDWDEPPARLAGSLRVNGAVTEATQTYRAALALNPNRQQALLALGALLIGSAAPLEATLPLLRCCGLAPHNLDAWSTLARAYVDANEPTLALEAFRQAQRLAPRSMAFVREFATTAIAAKRGEAEIARQEVASEHDPLNPVPHVARGLILDRLGLPGPAIDALEAAASLDPSAPEPPRLLATVLAQTTRSHETDVALRTALELDPGNPQLMNDRAVLLMRLHRHVEAIALLREVVLANGPYASILCNLASATLYLGMQDDAVELARSAIALEPEAVMPRRALTNTLPYQDSVTGAALLGAAQNCAATLSRGSLPYPNKSYCRSRALTIGLLSGTLRTHPVGWLTLAGIEHLDPVAFQIVCLSRMAEAGDPMSMRFQTTARSWENVLALDDAALATQARALDIDILIDLGGHGDAARMAACAHRLAPVQIKWVGMQNHSTGLQEIDWFLTDRWETPPALESLYSERILRMPDGYVCYSPPPHAPDVVTPPVLRNGFVTFGCFNNIAKITRRMIETWCGILHAVPQSRMILKTHQLCDVSTAARFLDTFSGFGIDRFRVEMRGSSSHRAFLASYNEIDLVLDPFPYSGGLTTCEALWMGVATVTLPGEIFASRHSASHLCNAGYPEWVARDLGNYRDIALRWAADPPGLARLRRSMREQVRASRLCDAPRFGRALGLALHHAWSEG